MKKKLLALTLGIIMLMSGVTGCGGETEAETSKVSSDGSGGKTLDLFANFTWLATDSWTGIIPEEITAETGTTLNVTTLMKMMKIITP